MKLRYIRVYNRPPLEDVSAVLGFESVLPRECAIHFVVGVNGSGKTRLLQAIIETLVSTFFGQKPASPVTLAYDLGASDAPDDARTVLLDYEADELVLAEYRPRLPQNIDWQNLLDDLRQTDNLAPTLKPSQLLRGRAVTAYSGIEVFLPARFLVYTSGSERAWREIFRPQAVLESVDIPEDPELMPFVEPDVPASLVNRYNTPTYGLLMTNTALQLAFVAVALVQMAQLQVGDGVDTAKRSWQRILKVVGWQDAITLSLKLSGTGEELFRAGSAQQRRERLLQLTSEILVEPADGEAWQSLIFDLSATDPAPTSADARVVAGLVAALGGQESSVSSFDVFNQLWDWHRSGVLLDWSLVVRKTGVDDLLLFDALSDGEQEFLGRMALFHLLRNEDDCLLVLDEPETHFNDVWKREIVDIIDDNLRDRANEVLVSTHSSIALTDVFDNEIILMRQSSDGALGIVPPPIPPTFGASPNEIMVNIFGASDPVGQRAMEFLDLVLMVAGYPNEMRDVWEQLPSDAVTNRESFDQLHAFVTSLSDYKDEVVTKDRLLQTLLRLKRYTEERRGTQSVSIEDALDLLEDRLGPGYYQFEFRRRLKALRLSSGNAAQN